MYLYGFGSCASAVFKLTYSPNLPRALHTPVGTETGVELGWKDDNGAKRGSGKIKGF